MKAPSQPLCADCSSLADSHRDRLRNALLQISPATLITEFVPAERARWTQEDPAAQEVLTELYRQLGPQLRRLLCSAYPGELVLAEAVWERILANPSDAPSSWPVEADRLADLLDSLQRKGRLQEHVFSSHIPIVGPLIAGFRRLWYNMAARWGVLTLANQQQAFNSELIEILDTVERFVIENDRAITQLRRRIAELESQLPGDPR
jgi:hypothetical protein